MNFLVFLLATLVSGFALARPEIIVPAQIEISHRPVLMLGDVVDLYGFSVKGQGILESIVLVENAKELSISQKIPSSEILSVLRQALKENEDLRSLNPSLKVPSEVKVSFSKTQISAQEVERKILNHLRTRCGQCDYSVSIQSVPAVESLDWTMDYKQVSDKGGFLVPLREKGQASVKWISGTIKLSKLTPVAKRLILQGERLTDADIQFEMKDVTYQEASDLKIEEIAGQTASRNLSRGSLIQVRDLRREPAAKRGQIVKALLGDEGFEITLSMQAEDSGQIGDVIKLKNLENSKVFSGTIVEKGVVKLQ